MWIHHNHHVPPVREHLVVKENGRAEEDGETERRISRGMSSDAASQPPEFGVILAPPHTHTLLAITCGSETRVTNESFL